MQALVLFLEQALSPYKKTTSPIVQLYLLVFPHQEVKLFAYSFTKKKLQLNRLKWCGNLIFYNFYRYTVANMSLIALKTRNSAHIHAN